MRTGVVVFDLEDPARTRDPEQLVLRRLRRQPFPQQNRSGDAEEVDVGRCVAAMEAVLLGVSLRGGEGREETDSS